MEHSEAIQLMAAEKYLLDELSAEVRDEFEEHLFGCHECAMDMRTASVFLEQGKAVLAEPEVATVRDAIVRDKDKSRPGLFAWLRPAFAVPAMAALLLVIGYQNLVTFPHLARAVKQMKFLPATTLHLSTYGISQVPVREGEDFLLNVIVPPGHSYEAYKADLQNPAGGITSVPISPSDDTWPIQVSATNLQSGSYTLTVYGITASDQDEKVGSTSFQLQIQK
jgi:hypothetical protein